MNNKKQILTLVGCLVIGTAHAAPDLDAAMANPNNWAHARGQYNNQGYSELSQINTKNVKDLKLDVLNWRQSWARRCALSH